MSAIPEALDSNTDHMGINDLIAFMLILADKSEAHPVLKDTKTEYYTQPAEMREMAGNLSHLRDASANGDKGLKAEKMAFWQMCRLKISMNAQHINMLALHRNDPTILNDTGYPFKQKQQISKPAVNLLEEIPQVLLKYIPATSGSESGFVSGAMVIVVSRPKTTVPFELQMTENPADESSWGSLGIHAKSRIERRGLESARRIYVRARIVLDGGTGKWSPVASLIIL